jgi:hypothetical protein
MPNDGDFVLMECSLVRRGTGRSCTNLRELLEAVRTAPEDVLGHQMMRCALDDHFELYEFPNELARWCWESLGVHALGEALGLVDPYAYASLAECRQALISVIEDFSWESSQAASCPPGRELHLVASQLVAFDTEERLTSPAALADSVGRMSVRSLFYHVHEARRRTAGKTDDFSAWLEGYGAAPELVAGIRGIDFYFLNLKQLRSAIVDVFRNYLTEPEIAHRVNA